MDLLKQLQMQGLNIVSYACTHPIIAYIEMMQLELIQNAADSTRHKIIHFTVIY